MFRFLRRFDLSPFFISVAFLAICGCPEFSGRGNASLASAQNPASTPEGTTVDRGTGKWVWTQVTPGCYAWKWYAYPKQQSASYNNSHSSSYAPIDNSRHFAYTVYNGQPAAQVGNTAYGVSAFSAVNYPDYDLDRIFAHVDTTLTQTASLLDGAIGGQRSLVGQLIGEREAIYSTLAKGQAVSQSYQAQGQALSQSLKAAESSSIRFNGGNAVNNNAFDPNGNPSNVNAIDGLALFQKHCSDCHGSAEVAKVNNTVQISLPDLNAESRRIVLARLTTSDPTRRMPAKGHSMPDEARAQLIEYLYQQ